MTADATGAQVSPGLVDVKKAIRKLNALLLGFKLHDGNSQPLIQPEEIAHGFANVVDTPVPELSLEVLLRHGLQLSHKLGTDGQSELTLRFGHQASPSVGAPSGASVGTPIVGAEKGDASDFPADAPPAHSARLTRHEQEDAIIGAIARLAIKLADLRSTA